MPDMTEPTGRVRVATLNVWGHGGSWPLRRSVLRAGFAALRPDVIAFQEALVTPAYDQVRDILGDGYHIVHQAKRAPDGSGCSIASRWRLEIVHELDLHVTPRTNPDFPCTTLIANVDAPQPTGNVLFANHLPSWQLAFEHEREVQAVAAARAIEELCSGDQPHVIVAGDLDADPTAGSVRFWTGRQALDGTSVCYRDAWESRHPDEPGQTFGVSENPLGVDWDWPFRRIDYVFVRCGAHGGPTLEIKSCERIFDQPVGGVWASDHFGLRADLELPR
jgi:endonuclease/exonuclease/phosphatase family metal-dependent hydrolase